MTTASVARDSVMVAFVSQPVAQLARDSVMVAVVGQPLAQIARVSLMVAVAPESKKKPSHGHRSPLSFGRR